MKEHVFLPIHLCPGNQNTPLTDRWNWALESAVGNNGATGEVNDEVARAYKQQMDPPISLLLYKKRCKSRLANNPVSRSSLSLFFGRFMYVW